MVWSLSTSQVSRSRFFKRQQQKLGDTVALTYSTLVRTQSCHVVTR